jgi:hypothetical protein
VRRILMNLNLRESIRRLLETTIYYRGTNSDYIGPRISTGIPEWDNNLFVSKDKDLATAYGKEVEEIIPKSTAKIIRETPRGFPTLKVYKRSTERYMDYLLRSYRAAKDQGYDIIEYQRQGDVGTVIINPDSVIRPVL